MASGECLNLSEPAASSAKASQGSALRTKLDHADEWLIADRERCGPRHLPEGPAASCCSVATGRTPAPSEELGCRDPPLHPRLCPQGQLASRGRHPGGCAGPMWDPWKTDCLSSLLGWLRPHGVWWGGCHHSVTPSAQSCFRLSPLQVLITTDILHSSSDPPSRTEAAVGLCHVSCQAHGEASLRVPLILLRQRHHHHHRHHHAHRNPNIRLENKYKIGWK